LETISKLSKKLKTRERQLNERKDPISPKDFNIQRSPLLFRKRGKRKRLTVSEKISVAYKAIMDFEKIGDIAKEFRVSRLHVLQIVK